MLQSKSPVIRNVWAQILFFVGVLCGGFLLHCSPPPTPIESSNNDAGETIEGNAPAPSTETVPDTPSGNHQDFFVVPAKQAIAYQTGWSWEGATWEEKSKTYRFHNDLGYTFWLKSGYVGLVTLRLVPCPGEEPLDTMGNRTPQPPTPPILRLLRRLRPLLQPLRWGVTNAYAEHSFQDDSSRSIRSVAESLFDPDLLDYGEGKASGLRYCQLHSLYTTLTKTTRDGGELKQSSIHIRGSYQAPGSQERKPLEAKLALYIGALAPLQTWGKKAQHPVPTNSKKTSVLVLRRPALSWDGLQPDKLDPLTLGQKVLLRLGQTTQAYVHIPE